MTRDDAFARLARARTEYVAAGFAIDYVAAKWDHDADVARAGRDSAVTPSELRRASSHLQVTFVLRLFSEFESILRSYWRDGLGKTTLPDMRPLMDSIANRRQMDAVDLDRAHQVREFRNDVTHAALLVPRFDVAACQRGLGRYLRWLPQQW